MSDYTSTFTENTGDTIDVTDFNTEFNAIQTAIATKFDTADLLDEDDMATNGATNAASQQSVKAYADRHNANLGSAVATTSGATVELSASIPTWVNEVTINLNVVSGSSTGTIEVQIGDGSYVTSGYDCSSGKILAASAAGSTGSSGFIVYVSPAASDTFTGTMVIRRFAASSNLWIATGVFNLPGQTEMITTTGYVTLTGDLDRARLSVKSGAFDAGSASIGWRA